MLLFGATIFVSAFLLFQIQPIISKAILPWFGGAAGVWNTCMLFFQAMLLGGYTYAHWLQGQTAQRQRRVHLALLGLSVCSLPVLPAVSWKPAGPEDPVWRILGLLTATIGVPYFLLGTTTPLLQAWFVRYKTASLPWRLFALSNAASLGALLTYPFLVEPALSVPQQSWIWSGAYAVFLLLAGRVTWKYAAEAPPLEAAGEIPDRWATAGVRVLWVALAACASILLLGITSHLTQDVAAIPFLWVMPLAVYLLSFILCFESPEIYRRPIFLPALAIALIAFGRVLARPEDSVPVVPNILLSAGVLFVCCMVCHGELAALKPAPRFLTGYYLSLSLGGVCGGLFVALAAPLLFDSNYELYAGLWLCPALAAITFAHSGTPTAARRTVLAGMLVATGAYGAWLLHIQNHEVAGVELSVRNFYGHLRVAVSGEAGETGAARQLVHGRITHGQQLLDPARRLVPSSYFCRSSGAGRASLLRQPGIPVKAGIIGVGCGALLGYGQKGDAYRLYEINPLIFDIARSHFTFLADTSAKVTTVLGDGRLSLEREEPQGFDLLFMDAFSGDAVPVHLVTREAFDLYQRHLKPEGILVVNITNNYLDLAPVVAAAAERLGKVALEIDDSPGEGDDECYVSVYALMMSPERFATTPALHRGANQIRSRPGFPEWTDAFSNLLAIVRR